MLYTKKHKTRLLINLPERPSSMPVHRLICSDDTVKKEKSPFLNTQWKQTEEERNKGNQSSTKPDQFLPCFFSASWSTRQFPDMRTAFLLQFPALICEDYLQFDTLVWNFPVTPLLPWNKKLRPSNERCWGKAENVLSNKKPWEIIPSIDTFLKMFILEYGKKQLSLKEKFSYFFPFLITISCNYVWSWVMVLG